MRTNIVLDDELVKHAQELTGIKTKRAVVDQALRVLVMVHERIGIRELRGKLKWEGDLDQSRLSIRRS
jgi:Arc/MetJ family transcription regulator